MSDLLREAINSGAIPQGYREIEDREFFKFSNPGDFIQGKYVESVNQKAGNNMTKKYTVKRKGDNELVSFLGSTQLDEKMRRIPLGQNIIILFDRSEGSSGDNKSPMKFYKVFVEDPRPTTGRDGITL